MIQTSVPKEIVPDLWLNGIFDRPVYEIVLDSGWKSRLEDLGASIRAIQEKPVFMFAKISTGALEAAAALKGFGFRAIDTQVTFEKTVTGNQNYIGKCTLRWANSGDEEAVAQLAKHNSITSRFHLDPAIPKQTADRVKEEWVRNYFRGRRGNRLAFAQVDQKPSGFLQLIHGSDGLMIIDLIATDGSERRKGIASDMIAFCENEGRGFSRIRVGTQASNRPSIQLYEKLGFKATSVEYIFHYHHLPKG